MNSSFYLSIHNYVLEQPRFHRLVALSVKVLPGIVYLTYPLMLLFVLLFAKPQLFRTVLVPFSGFLICTVIRAAINAPRPYEALGIPAITKKDTRGKSFPSRHAACASVIAITALYISPPLGILLLAVSLLIAVTRVLAGVHFIRDVLAGWLLGALVAILGMFL